MVKNLEDVLCWRTKQEFWSLTEEKLDERAKMVVSSREFSDWKDYLENRCTNAEIGSSVIGFSNETYTTYIKEMGEIKDYMTSLGFSVVHCDKNSIQMVNGDMEAMLWLKDREEVVWESVVDKTRWYIPGFMKSRIPNVRYQAKEVTLGCTLKCRTRTKEKNRIGELVREYVTENYDMEPPTLLSRFF